MHDKVVRRRRAVLALLVIVSLVLLTAYFGKSSSSPLHGAQRGVVAVLSPVQNGASKALSPVRNVSNWVSTTLHAKTQRDEYRREYDQLEARVARLQQAAIENRQLSKLVGLDQQIGASAYDPVAASVIIRDPNVWYQQVEVDKGSDAGVRPGDPVLAEDGLIGKVSVVVNGSSSIVVLITDHTVGVAAEVQDHAGDAGVLEPAVGDLNRLSLEDLPNQAQISPGALVVTAGFKDPAHPSQPGSLYPPGIPIGQVADFSQDSLIDNGSVPVTPLAAIRQFTAVQILTKPYASHTEAADVTSSHGTLSR